MLLLLCPSAAHRQHVLIVQIVELRRGLVIALAGTLRLPAFGQSLSVLLFGVVCVPAQLAICSLEFVQVAPGYLATTKQQGHRECSASVPQHANSTLSR